MIISKIKDLGEFYLVNDLLSVPKDPLNKDYAAILLWLEDPDNELEDITAELLEKAIKDKSREIDNQKNRALLADLTINVESIGSVELQVDNKYIIYILQSLIDIGNNVQWILKDDTIATFTIIDLTTFRDALTDRNDEVSQARKRKDIVTALETIKEVEEYDITTIEL